MIREQIEDAEATVAREVADFEARYPPEAFVRQELEPAPTEEQPKQQDTSEHQPDAPEPPAEPKEAQEAMDTAGAQSNNEQSSEPSKTDAPTNGTDTAAHEQSDAHNDDGGEVVEDNEDTVIY